MVVLSLLFLSGRAGAGDAEATFLRDAFGRLPEPATLWLTGARADQVTQLLGEPYASLRVRYWREGSRSAWVLEAIGKLEPITVGLLVNAGKIERVRVLVYRESRGGEVQRPAFTQQFDGAALRPDRTLDRHIDGISGATLSVRALKKLARLALFLHGEIQQEIMP